MFVAGLPLVEPLRDRADPSAPATERRAAAGEPVRVRASRTPTGSDSALSGAGSQAPATVVTFVDGDDLAQGLVTGPQAAVIAHVIGDRLWEGLRGGGSKRQAPVPARSPDVAVELKPSPAGQLAEVRLRHPQLGPLRLLVQLLENRVSVQVLANRRAAVRAVAAAEPGLRQALRFQGLCVIRFVVQVRGADGPGEQRPPHTLIDEEA